MAFPTFWQLLLPNLNVFTIIAIILIVLAVLAFFLNPTIFWQFSFFAFGAAVLLLWIPSIIQDFLSTTEGIFITLGGAFVLLLGYYYIMPSKKKKR